ncbi:MAG: hypothetical protein L0Z07_00835 [Planctomycetes bacterium]|nr:hypothetical protein [Planctomycetota bacterium]
MAASTTSCDRRSPGRPKCYAIVLFVASQILGCGLSRSNAAEFEVDYDPFAVQHASHDPFETGDAAHDPFEQVPRVLPTAKAERALGIAPPEAQASLNAIPAPRKLPELQPPRRLALLQSESMQSESLPPPDGEATALPDPCRGAPEKPISDLTINIQMPSGDLPQDHAAACWEQIDAQAGPFAAARCWPVFNYHWNATCLYHRPLYFEEINLERYGYGCHACLQPAISAAHFFGTVPALPYCMTADCPGECVYTLGHYRPGSCPPWRRHCPPCDAVAGASEAGVLTGLIFLIP